MFMTRAIVFQIFVLSSLIAGSAALGDVTPLAEPGVTVKQVRFAMINPATGVAAENGLGPAIGANMAVNKVNSHGGVGGRSIELVHYDDMYEPQKTLTFAKQIVAENKTFAVFNTVGTPTSKAAFPILERAGIPFLFPRTGDSFVRDGNRRLIFNIRASSVDEMGSLIELAIKRGKSKIAILAQSDALGASLKGATQRAISKHGLKFVAEGEVGRNSDDVKKAFDLISAANPDAIVLGAVAASSLPFITLAEKSGKKWFYLATSPNNPLAGKLGDLQPEIVLSQVMPNPATSELPIVVEFRKDLKDSKTEIGKHDPFGLFEGYLNARLIIEALKRNGPTLTRESFLSALEAEPFDLGGIKVDYDKSNHNGHPALYLTTIKNDKLVDYK
jgi:branched-chain amino acid transport system substrate-binding protein